MSQQKDVKQQAAEFLEKAGTVSLEYLNKFKSKVATTVVDTVYSMESITKSVIPGNPVTRDYEIVKHVGSAGPGLLWKIYAGYKKSTKQEASVFVLHKKCLESYSKKEREQIIESFKKGATQLARLKHPRILSLQHQLEESKESLAFATEPCFCSLANVFGNHLNMPEPLPVEFTSYKPYDVEIKYGLMQLAEALSFIHKDAKLMHRNICTETIIINSNGAWKLACFELSATNNNEPNDPIKYPFKEWDASLPIVMNPSLEYLAPEYALSTKCDCSSDMFSYGMLFVSVYNNGKSLYQCNANYSTYVSNIEELRKLKNTQLGGVPADVKEYLKLLLHVNNELRPDASQVLKIPFFDDVAVKTLEYLDSSFQVDNLQKSIFFKSLSQIIDKLPKRVCLQRVVPCLEQEFINPDMIPFVLPNIFFIADIADNDEYVKYILPKIRPVFQLQKPVQVLIIMLKNMNLLLSKTPASDIKEHILPMVCRALDAAEVEVVELCLSTLPSFAGLIDNQSIKHLLLPRIKKLILESQTLSIRVNSLVCVGKLLENLEKWLVLDDIIPIIEKIHSRESSVLMAMLGIYRITLTHPKLGITKDMLATRVLPHLIPLSIDNNLNISQFNQYMALIREMLTQIETDHRKKLEQIEVLDREKSIIPYSFAQQSGGSGGFNNNSSRVNEKKSDTLMDQLMRGYGVNANAEGSTLAIGVAPKQLAITDGRTEVVNDANNTNTGINNPILPKRELTLKEKQEAAMKIQQEIEKNEPQKIHNLSKPPSSSSMSFNKTTSNNNNSNQRDLADNLLDMNLNSLSNSKSSTNSTTTSNLSLLTESFQYNNNNLSNNLPNMPIMGNNNNQFIKPLNNNNHFPSTASSLSNNNMNNLFNQSNNTNFQRMNTPMMPNHQFQTQQNTSQMGFFGNFALPPATSSSSTNNAQTRLSSSTSLNNNPNNKNDKKSPFDDLADLLG